MFYYFFRTSVIVYFHFTHTHTQTILRPSCILFGTTRVSRHQKGKTSLNLLEQQIVSGSGNSGSYANLHLDLDTTMLASHHSVFYRPDALPAAQPTASKHWRHSLHFSLCDINNPVSVTLSLAIFVPCEPILRQFLHAVLLWQLSVSWKYQVLPSSVSIAVWWLMVL